MSQLTRILRDTRGTGMTEYIILVGVVAILAISAFRIFGEAISRKLSGQGQTLQDNLPATEGPVAQPPSGG